MSQCCGTGRRNEPLRLPLTIRNALILKPCVATQAGFPSFCLLSDRLSTHQSLQPSQLWHLSGSSRSWWSPPSLLFRCVSGCHLPHPDLLSLFLSFKPWTRLSITGHRWRSPGCPPSPHPPPAFVDVAGSLLSALCFFTSRSFHVFFNSHDKDVVGLSTALGADHPL